jgi:16S rRNA (guanine(527)-N(7))-methyltransferase RsmG
MDYGEFFSAEQTDKFNIYEKLLAEQNKVMNLTAISGYGEVFEKHFIDSVLPLRFFDIPQNAALIDVGTGAGFPGVPLKIVRSDISLTCLDSTLKKVEFLRELSTALETPFEAICARAEEAANDERFRERFDIAVSRAVAALPVLAELCLPFVKPGGVFIALKGEKENISDAENAVKILGAEVLKCEKYELPSGDRRQLFVFLKTTKTPIEYPREFAKIKRKPL